mgnify:CR=1 FL=1
MGGYKRKIRRNQAKSKMKEAQKDMQQKLGMFDKLGDECSACEKPFDKKSKEHAMTWNVVVREEEEIVRLYCPECWDKANKIIKEIKDDFRNAHEAGRKVSDKG